MCWDGSCAKGQTVELGAEHAQNDDGRVQSRVFDIVLDAAFQLTIQNGEPPCHQLLAALV